MNETLAKMKSKRYEITEQKQSAQREIGEFAWERCLKREMSRQTMIQMSKDRESDITIKKKRLIEEQADLEEIKAKHADMITQKAEINRSIAVTETNKVCVQQGDLPFSLLHNA
jgi:hypothetical protein